MDYEMDPPEKKYTTAHDRYTVSTDGPGLIGTRSFKIDAFQTAILYANKWNVPVTVYDRMARIGKAQSWTIHPGMDPTSCNIVLPPASVRT